MVSSEAVNRRARGKVSAPKVRALESSFTYGSRRKEGKVLEKRKVY